MSSAVQRPQGASGVPAPKRPGRNGPDQHWGMLLFESLSAGAISVGIGLAAVTVVVGTYALLVWPLTFWDLAGLGLEQYSPWASTAIWSIFAGGTLAGFWCFSGAAFKGKAKPKVKTSDRVIRTRR